ncbi:MULTISPECIES: LysR family transcriptional regulator [unclassified Bradyrhizobium]|uniref:LysR family transcriptional regulator n=1 Tax=unclassified Bradyrhizobium TaxID=2631580 RepID=UPI00247A38CD|nr:MULTISPECIES: LysR family transcriptional regulator [unclassified Bradyrhizobium]WGR70470.1 LysR family transcriptional regulator [Bradyrhizobium sp. ISRA426]WGR82526.1 LysR family transcriptional regulator [Bradyrhizobium sp. ISRA430]WGR85713.1 LysR family transcriptional regulator [Bradyrhizobium sp. ISRA432]
MAGVTMEWESRLGRRLRVRDLYILSSVVKCGGMAKAARELAMTQPAVSDAIANLELLLRVRLLDRSPRGIEPTQYADALLKRASTVFDELKQGVRDIEFLADPTSGNVRVGCAESFMAGLLPAIIEKLTQRYPKITIHADYAQHATAEFRELRERNVDLVIGRISEPFPHDDLTTEPLYEERYYVVVGAQNPWARSRKVSLGDLANEQWIHMPPNNIISDLISAAFAKQSVPVPQERVASLSMHLRTQLVANAGFITIMPNSMFQFNAKRWGLKALPIDLGIKGRNVSIVTLKHRTLSSVVQVFIEHARLASRQLRQETN